MALKPYLVQRPYTRSVDNVTAVAVMAVDAAQAKAMANAHSTKDTSAAWTNATVTEIAATSTDWIGWTFRVVVRHPTTGANVVDVSVAGDATNNTIDEVGALLVTALNATTPISNASYTTNTLTAAAIADGLGDHDLVVEAYAPNGDLVPGIFGATVEQGIAGAVLTAVMPADADVAPAIVITAGAF